jgi:hypothetical protein
MGITGSWAAASGPRAYAAATKQGTGYNPIHEVRDGGRGRDKDATLPGEALSSVPPALTADDIDWCSDYYVSDTPMDGEAWRYVDSRPKWNQEPPDFRDMTNSEEMGETQAWGPHFDSGPDGFPIPGPTGGAATWLDIDRGEVLENQRAIAVPTRGVSGGWKNKDRGPLAVAEAQDPGPWEDGYVPAVQTSWAQGQGVRRSDNDRAQLRGTDAPRSAIEARTAGMRVRTWPSSFGNGGGAGTADMFPFQQSSDYRKPWMFRRSAAPPAEAHTFNTMEGRIPLTRSIPTDPYQGDTETGDGSDYTDSEWGY